MIVQKHSLLSGIICVSLLSSSTQMEALNVRSSIVWFGLTIAGLTIYWKYKKPVMLAPEETLLRALKKARTMKEFFHILERWIIGHPGQPSSIKLSAEGRTRLASELIVNLEKGIPPYGFCGITWTYVKCVYEGLKAMKDLHDTAKFFELTL